MSLPPVLGILTRLRIVFVEWWGDDSGQPRPQIQQASLDLILARFHIATAFDYGTRYNAGLLSLPYEAAEDGKYESYICSTAYGSSLQCLVAWSHDYTRGISEGLCLAHRGFISEMKHVLSCQTKLASHPMLLGLAAGTTVCLLLDRELKSNRESLGEIQGQTWFHPWNPDRLPNGPGSHFVKASKKMSGMATTLARLQTNVCLVDQIVDSVKELGRNWATTSEVRGSSLSQALHQSMEQGIRTLSRHARVQELAIAQDLSGCRTQLTAVSYKPFSNTGLDRKF